MRRPLPPELIALGDALEAAAMRALARRRQRRQMVLNAAASIAVALPLAISVATASFDREVVTPTPTPSAGAKATIDHPRPTSAGPRFPGVNLPREQVRLRPELVNLPSTLRPALR